MAGPGAARPGEAWQGNYEHLGRLTEVTFSGI